MAGLVGNGWIAGHCTGGAAARVTGSAKRARRDAAVAGTHRAVSTASRQPLRPLPIPCAPRGYPARRRNPVD
ncbi:hypothetical protein LGM46_32365 [Burkholderia arboris]|uniref:hypothetical protein n=1 Tax=Burkholderia arboris TaxID=488730 RepID=UPI001CF1C06E|nr:hypothetical protein [Burkholderia arboris]MCA8037664.1 hypothetical protein [Burkholderia arboris]